MFMAKKFEHNNLIGVDVAVETPLVPGTEFQ